MAEAAPTTPSPAPAAPAPQAPAAAPAPAPTAAPAAAPAPSASSPAPGAAKPPTEAAKPPAEAVRSLFDDPALKAPEGEKAPEKPTEAPKEGEKPPEEAKPVEYKDFTLPEGVEAKPEQLAEFKAQAAKFGLTQEAAQAMVDRHGTLLKQAVEGVYSQWEAQKSAWQAEVKADPEIGGENFAPVMKGIKSGLQDVLNGQEYTISTRLPDGTKSTAKVSAVQAFLDVLGYTGAANNPIVIKTLRALTMTRSEGGPVTGQAPTTPPKSLGARLYGGTQKEG